MDDRVIEAAAEAILTEFGEVPYYRDMAEVAIRAADAARAEAVKAAVRAVVLKSVELGKADCLLDQVGLGGEMLYQDCHDGLWASQKELFALLGIED